jgi:hypothetical protein
VSDERKRLKDNSVLRNENFHNRARTFDKQLKIHITERTKIVELNYQIEEIRQIRLEKRKMNKTL